MLRPTCQPTLQMDHRSFKLSDFCWLQTMKGKAAAFPANSTLEKGRMGGTMCVCVCVGERERERERERALELCF